MKQTVSDETIKDAVREAYGGVARRFLEEPARQPAQGGCCGPSEGPAAAQASCCGPSEERMDAQASCCGPAEPAQASCCGPSSAAECGAARFYDAGALADLPESVTEASLGCGNPLAIASLQPGEVVLDLGSGGGIDCFLAARKVGPEGRVIGLDMTPDMIKLARRNAKKMGVTNVDFRYGEMEEIPLPDESVDVIISNCVINLSPDKDAVFQEAFRVLRPGGRISVSDIVVDGKLPAAVRDHLGSWAACVSGALEESDYLGKIRAAGFEQVDVASREVSQIDEATGWEDVQLVVVGGDGGTASGAEAQAMLAEAGLSPRDLARAVASIKVTAYKPG